MNCLLVPTLALDLSLIERLANSLDYPIAAKFVINNGKVGALRQWLTGHPDWTLYETGYNHGVAGSWNLAPGFFPLNQWLIVNDDEELQPGCLEKICKCADNHPEADIIYVNPYDAFDIFVWTRNAVNKFGTFDENFWPAYYEDWEIRLRFSFGNAKKVYVGDETFPVKHGRTRPGGPRYMNMLKHCGYLNRDYFMRKWGTIDDKHPEFATPFNKFIPISQWELEKSNRELREAIWKSFWNVPNPSIYE